MNNNFRTAEEWLNLAQKQGVSLAQVVIGSEVARSGLSQVAVLDKMCLHLQTMHEAVQAGIREPAFSRSGLTGGGAYNLAQAWERGETLTSSLYLRASLYALAVAEVNAAMGLICAAPTAGSAGVVPAVLLALAEEIDSPEPTLLEALFVAAGVGQVAAEQAELVGAALGCQAEIGVAAAMAAAGGAYLAGCTAQAALDAGALALQNLLGLACDPVAGFVEIPCVARNAAAATNALTCVELVRAGFSSPIPLDEVISAMVDIGKRLPLELRETSRGGLALTPTGQRLAQNCRLK